MLGLIYCESVIPIIFRSNVIIVDLCSMGNVPIF